MTRPRKPHLLKPSTSLDRPQNVIWFDTESRQTNTNDLTIKHTLRLGHAKSARFAKSATKHTLKELDFYDNDSFWDWVDLQIRVKTTTYITAHNIIFDLAVTNGFTNLADRGYELQSFYTKGITSIFRWKKGSSKLIGIDNGNLFPGKLEDWGKVFGYPKGHVDFETVEDPELLIYCRRDVEIMYKSWISWIEFLDTHDCGKFCVTVGSTAFNTWLHRFIPAKVHIHTNPLAISLEREAYKGGRVECLYQGRHEQGPYYYLDVNNMYGYVLTRYLYPAGIWDAKPCDSVSMLIRKLEKYAVIARVIVNVNEPYFPHKVNGCTAYPLGRFETTLTTPELIIAFQKGWLESVSFMSWYRQEPLFSDFIKYFYALRQEYKRSNNLGYAAICKLFNNSLYGKFGQQGFEQKRIGSVDPDIYYTESVFDIDKRDYYRHIALAGGLYEERKTGESYNAFTAIAAHVTAYARLYLTRLFTSVPRGHVFYMDTDSLIVDSLGRDCLSNLLDNDRLGSLKVELESSFIEIRAPKDYSMEGRNKIKGVSSTAVENPDGSYTQLQWERLSSMIARKSTDGFQTHYVTKHNQRKITSGVVSPSGWVEPFRLDLVPDLVDLGPVQAEVWGSRS
jgi:DNA polymerase type B, organellar and viral